MKRLLTALALVAFAVYLVFFAPSSVFAAAALFVGLLCYWEFSGLVVAHGISRPGLVGVLLGFAIIFRPLQIFWISPLLLALELTLLLRRVNLREIVPEAGSMILGAFYAFTPWRLAVDLRHQSIHLLFFALALNWVGDSAAFYFGRQFGKHKLAPVISPGKSWEGAIASVAASTLFGLLYLGKALPSLSLPIVMIMAIGGNVAGQFGDLVESSIKRGAGLKDSGNLLPGHGGVLDRLDSSMFAVPVVYSLYAFSCFILAKAK
ncbi:MAG: phosphatidate cytidylyltransferase [Bryobacteraceae bacterium]